MLLVFFSVHTKCNVDCAIKGGGGEDKPCFFQLAALSFQLHTLLSYNTEGGADGKKIKLVINTQVNERQ